MTKSANIPLARAYLTIVLQDCKIDDDARKYVTKAVGMMTRKSPISRTKPKRKPITPALRRTVKKLHRDGKSMHAIATETGLGNGGRVSDIVNGKL